jgi:alkylation response protein AidB-like acyl-CoA dehydrogenase
MDFTQVYSEEQERFREEVRGWLEENVPEKMKKPYDMHEFTEEQYLFWREKHKELAKKGWLWPTSPKEYGGGGLTGDHETIIEEEFARAQACRSFSRGHVHDTLMVWGTEEQRQKFLRPFLTGEKITWQKLTEPQSGADLANVQSRAVRDGDDWILNGQNVFIGDTYGPDYITGPMVTDPDAPRHRNLGYFVIPVPSPGLTMRHMDVITAGVGGKKNAIFLENVRVPGDHLIGGDHQGWQVMSTHLEREHGGGGKAFPRDEQMENLLEYVRETEQDGSSLGSDPVVQQAAMDVYIRSHVQSLMLKRTYWMYQNRLQIQSEGSLADVHGRLSKDYIKVLDVMGMYSLLGTNEPRAPHGGFQEVQQRAEAGQHHGAGSTNIAKVILSRRIGISRTEERAAPTPSTASTGGS